MKWVSVAGVVAERTRGEVHGDALALDGIDLLADDGHHGGAQGRCEQRLEGLLDEIGRARADVTEEFGDIDRPGLFDLARGAIAGDVDLAFEDRRDQNHRSIGA